MPQSFKDIIELLLPELRKRGLFWSDYAVPGGTYRENLTGVAGQNEPTPDHPAHAYIWRNGPKSSNIVSGGSNSAYGNLDHLNDRYASVLSAAKPSLN